MNGEKNNMDENSIFKEPVKEELAQDGKKPTDTTSLVLGIVAVVAAAFIPLVSYICGIIGIVFAIKRRKDKRTTVALILCIVGIISPFLMAKMEKKAEADAVAGTGEDIGKHYQPGFINRRAHAHQAKHAYVLDNVNGSERLTLQNIAHMHLANRYRAAFNGVPKRIGVMRERTGIQYNAVESVSRALYRVNEIALMV